MISRLVWLFAILGLLACDSKSNKVVFPNVEDEGVVETNPNKVGTSSWNLSKIVSLDSVRAMPAGTKMYVRTSVFGKMEDFEVTLVSVVDDFVPPMPVIMFEFSRPAVHGESGSPVFTKNGVVGALSMGFDSENRAPYYFFATPIEWMQKGIITTQEIRSGKPVVWNGNTVRPLALPLLMSGVSNRLVDTFMRKHGGKFGAGNSFMSVSGSAGLSNKTDQEFEPGSPLAVALFTGDEVHMGAVGTVTYIDGNNIIGFGHPFLGNGQTSLPIIGAEILAEISNINAPFKFSSLGNKILGTITYDRMPGVGGVLGQESDMIPLILNASVFGERAFSMNHRMVRVNLSGAGLFNKAFGAGITLLSPLSNRLDDLSNKSLKIRTEISFTNSDLKIDRERTYSYPNTGLAELLDGAMFDFIFNVYLESMTNAYTNLEIKNIQMSVDVLDEALFAIPVALEADSVVTAGENLSIKLNLRVAGTKDESFNVSLVVPDTFKTGIYNLMVGSVSVLMDDVPEDETPNLVEFGNLNDIFADINGPDGKTTLRVVLAFSEPIPTEISADSLVDAISDAAKIDSVLGSPQLPSVIGTPPMLLPVPEKYPVYNDRTSMEKKLDWVLPEGFGAVRIKVLEKK